jgi:hypothetical protein
LKNISDVQKNLAERSKLFAQNFKERFGFEVFEMGSGCEEGERLDLDF